MAKTTHNENNKFIVHNLYKALAKGEGRKISKHFASDLEWWFHGPPHCQHMRRMLTGELAHTEFEFNPWSITTIDDDWVIVEGWEGPHAYWVHAWTFKGGVITQFREYFNTWLIVRDLRPHNNKWEIRARNKKVTLWQSQLHGHDGSQSMPGLVLAI